MEMGKPELPVQPSSNLRFEQFTSQAACSVAAGDYLLSRAGGNEGMSSHKSLQAEVQELSLSP